jgi:hypothetical protein
MCSPQINQSITADDAGVTEISASPDRHSFQRQGYIKRMAETGEPANPDYLDYFEKILAENPHRFDDPASRENNLEYDLLTTDWILQKVRDSDVYAQNLYAALCNNEFQRQAVMPVLRDQRWSCTWRYAGGIIADMRQQGDYIDWYCSGIAGGDEPAVYEQEQDLQRRKYVSESVITDAVRADLARLGWSVCDERPDTE